MKYLIVAVVMYLLTAVVLTIFSVKKSETFISMPTVAKGLFIVLLPVLAIREYINSLSNR